MSAQSSSIKLIDNFSTIKFFLEINKYSHNIIQMLTMNFATTGFETVRIYGITRDPEMENTPLSLNSKMVVI
jgi:hypothetical protein